MNHLIRTAASLALIASACASPAAPADASADDVSVDATSADVTADACPGLVNTGSAPQRLACTFGPGALAEQTLGLRPGFGSKLPFDHIIVVMSENRSFDHYFGQLPAAGKLDVDVWPADFSNPDAAGKSVPIHHLTSPCLTEDPPHGWAPMHAQYNSGAMDGFVKSAAGKSDGHYVLGYYQESDLPFYYWLAKTSAMSDRHFSSVMGPTWPNRDFLYAGTSNGVKETGGGILKDVPTIFDKMTEAGISWGVYSDGMPRQDALGWHLLSPGTHFFPEFLDALADGSLPSVSFVDPTGAQDEHPAANIHGGEAWVRSIYMAARASPLWQRTLIIFTYDEAGGMADHVPPPAACAPSADQPDFNRLGFRVPLFLLSPWARQGYVSHEVHDHTSILRLIELRFGLGALTTRDANADAMLDMLQFGCALPEPPTPPNAAVGACTP